jgi:hypothetical protein
LPSTHRVLNTCDLWHDGRAHTILRDLGISHRYVALTACFPRFNRREPRVGLQKIYDSEINLRIGWLWEVESKCGSGMK